MSPYSSAALLGLLLMMTGCGRKSGGVNIWDAVERGDGAAIKKFSASDGDLDVRNWGGSTPLWVALTEKNRDSYEALLKYGADPNVIMSGKRVVTHWAAAEPDSWWLRLALEHKADPNLVNVGRGRPTEGTPLKFAINKRNLKNVKLLVEHGADIDKPDRYNLYPLAFSMEQNKFEIVLYLLESGADYKLAQSSGISFLDDTRQKLKFREKKDILFRFEENRKKFDAVRAWLEKRGVKLRGK